MNPLAWNFEISPRMRAKPQIALGLLPIGLMFASFAPLFFFAAWLSSFLGIPENAPVRDQPYGFFWIVLLLVAMVLLMATGYLLGWILNAFILRIFFRSPWDQVRRVLLYSEVPVSWLKEGSAEPNTTWAVMRQKGKWRFIFQNGVLAWGMPMYLIMGVLPVAKGRPESDISYFFWQFCLWGAAGALFGFLIWHFLEKSFLKQGDIRKHE